MNKLQVHLFSSPLRDPETKELPLYIEQCVESWKTFFRHPSFSDRFVVQEWSEKDNESIQLQCSEAYDALASHPLGAKGRIDIFKWEVLYEFGGVFIDPNVHFICPWNEDMMSPVEDFQKNPFSCFVSHKHEITFGKQLCTSIIKFPPKHHLLKFMIDRIQMNALPTSTTDLSLFCGDALFTELVETVSKSSLHTPFVLPSYFFSPYEPIRGQMYNGHGRVYASVIADNLMSPTLLSPSAVSEYASILEAEREEGLDWTNVQQVLERFVQPSISFEVENGEDPWCLIIVFGGINPPDHLVNRWMESIAQQHGGLLFGIELVWIEDPASSPACKQMLNSMCRRFAENTRNTSVQLYCPPFTAKTSTDYDRIMAKVTQLFPGRDLVLHFHASKHLSIMHDLMFIARQMDLEQEGEEEDTKDGADS